ncbi:MAG: MAPEG family protein [Novosphingobium sp.]
MLLPTTLCLTAAAIIINFWLGVRVSKLRHALGVSVGDGGQEPLVRRMRAQANFLENTPLTLILIAGVELAGKGGVWLAPAGAVFILGRIAHAIGMDGGFKAGRPIGMLTTYVLQPALIVVAVLASVGRG